MLGGGGGDPQLYRSLVKPSWMQTMPGKTGSKCHCFGGIWSHSKDQAEERVNKAGSAAGQENLGKVSVLQVQHLQKATIQGSCVGLYVWPAEKPC